jgi:hypothetical protein
MDVRKSSEVAAELRALEGQRAPALQELAGLREDLTPKLARWYELKDLLADRQNGVWKLKLEMFQALQREGTIPGASLRARSSDELDVPIPVELVALLPNNPDTEVA